MKPQLLLALAGGLGAQVMAGEPRAERLPCGVEQSREGTICRCLSGKPIGAVRVRRYLAPSEAMTRPPVRAGWWRAHLADSALHLGATSLDMASSWGRPELNPLLRSADGRFGARGLTVKLAVFGGVELVKWRIARRHGKFARVLSLAPAGAYTGVAVRNWRAR